MLNRQMAHSTSPKDGSEIIDYIRQGYTQQEIGERIGWSREGVKNYQKLIDSVGTHILEQIKEHQSGRVPSKGTNVPTHNFTEGWFRNN